MTTLVVYNMKIIPSDPTGKPLSIRLTPIIHTIRLTTMPNFQHHQCKVLDVLWITVITCLDAVVNDINENRNIDDRVQPRSFSCSVVRVEGCGNNNIFIGFVGIVTWHPFQGSLSAHIRVILVEIEGWNGLQVFAIFRLVPASIIR